MEDSFTLETKGDGSKKFQVAITIGGHLEVYGKPSCQMLLQNNNKKEDYKTLKMEPCNPIVHLDGSMNVEVFFNGNTLGLALLKKIKMGKPSSYLRFNLVQGRTIDLVAL
jgi:hypothetical protein